MNSTIVCAVLLAIVTWFCIARHPDNPGDNCDEYENRPVPSHGVKIVPRSVYQPHHHFSQTGTPVILFAMTANDILAAIDAEIDHLQQARALLAGLDGSQPAKPKATRKKYQMSAEGRKRIVEAVRKRWAAKRKAVK